MDTLEIEKKILELVKTLPLPDNIHAEARLDIRYSLGCNGNLKGRFILDLGDKRIISSGILNREAFEDSIKSIMKEGE